MTVRTFQVASVIAGVVACMTVIHTEPAARRVATAAIKIGDKVPAILVVEMTAITIVDDTGMIKGRLGPIKIGGMTLITFSVGRQMPAGFIATMTGGTGQRRRVVVKYRGKPAVVVMAEIAFGCGGYVGS